MSVVVYTTIFGESDSLKPAPNGADWCVCFTDRDDLGSRLNGWQLAIYRTNTPRRTAWEVRCEPEIYLELPLNYFLHRGDTPPFDKIVWIDASFTLTNLPKLLKDTGDAPIAALRHHSRSSCYEEAAEIAKIGQASKAGLNRQMDAYHREGFASNHLSISCVIVRDSSEQVRRFNQTWAEQIATYPDDNTQLSLDYSAWKHGLTIKALAGVRKNNPYAVHDHSDHKRRRRDYATAVTR